MCVGIYYLSVESEYRGVLAQTLQNLLYEDQFPIEIRSHTGEGGCSMQCVLYSEQVTTLKLSIPKLVLTRLSVE